MTLLKIYNSAELFYWAFFGGGGGFAFLFSSVCFIIDLA